MIIIHGDNQVASRKQLNQYLSEFKGEIIRLEGDKIDLTALKQAIESKSLFGQERLVVMENLFRRRQSKLKEEILDYLKLNLPDNFIIWEGGKIDGRKLLSFSKTKIEKFVVPKIIFQFLDNLSPHKQKFNLNLFHQSLVNNEPELIFYWLEKQIRYLIIANDLGEKGLTEFPSWKKAILLRQAKKFSLHGLIQLYQRLLDIDYKQKTGKTPLPLISQLDLWLASF